MSSYAAAGRIGSKIPWYHLRFCSSCRGVGLCLFSITLNEISKPLQGSVWRSPHERASIPARNVKDEKRNSKEARKG